MSVFQKAQYRPSRKKLAITRKMPYNKETRSLCAKDTAQMTISWSRRPNLFSCCTSHAIFNKFNCQSYVVESSKDGVPVTGGDTSSCGREVGTVCEHLEGVNNQPLGTTDSQRVQNTLHLLTQSDHTTCRAGIPLRAGSSGEGGTPVPVGEGSSSPCNRLSQGFLLEYISGTQKEWPDETCNQPEAVERVGDYRALQDGGNLHSEGLVKIRGLVCDGGSERRLLHGSHRGQSSAILEIYARGEELPVHLPPLWPILCPPHLHQGTEAGNDSSQVLGSQDHRLHRRYAGPGRISGSNISAPGNHIVGTSDSGLHHQLGEVRSNQPSR